jgi:hypothetical protein
MEQTHASELNRRVGYRTFATKMYTVYETVISLALINMEMNH